MKPLALNIDMIKAALSYEPRPVRPCIMVPASVVRYAQAEGVDITKFYLENYGADWALDEPIPYG